MTIREQLNANIPRDVISTRSQSGKNLSYLEGWYVIDRLNQVLGTENWNWNIDQIIPISGDKLSYIVKGTISATIDGKDVFKDGVGYGSDKGNFNPGEMAIKEAETDALKRAAMKLGRSMGLSLYDKTQEYVDDNQVADRLPNKSAGRSSDTATSKAAPAIKGTDSKVLKGQIKNSFAVLQAQKKITKEDFVKDYTAGKKVDDLDDAAAKSIITKLKQNFPELGL